MNLSLQCIPINPSELDGQKFLKTGGYDQRNRGYLVRVCQRILSS